MDFDTEKFIIEIQKRPSIWNTKCSDYSDRNVKQKEWEDVVNVYGAELSIEEKKNLGINLQKKWRNIRDCFVKAYKSKEMNKSSAAKKKVHQYLFYDNLLFLKDTLAVNITNCNSTPDTQTNEESQNEFALNSYYGKAKRSKKNKSDSVGREVIGIFNKQSEQNNFEADDDRLFFLSLVKEFKKIPEQFRIHTKLDLLNVIKDAQYSEYRNTSWDYLRPNNPNRGIETAHYSRSTPYVLPIQSPGCGNVPPQEATVSPVGVILPALSMHSTTSHGSADRNDDSKEDRRFKRNKSEKLNTPEQQDEHSEITDTDGSEDDGVFKIIKSETLTTMEDDSE